MSVELVEDVQVEGEEGLQPSKEKVSEGSQKAWESVHICELLSRELFQERIPTYQIEDPCYQKVMKSAY